MKLTKIATILLFAILISGCTTISTTLKQGSNILESAYSSLENDFLKLQIDSNVMIENPTPETTKKFRETEATFKKGLDAVGFALREMNKTIQKIDTEK